LIDGFCKRTSEEKFAAIGKLPRERQVLRSKLHATL
jgi:hypothetical protein